MPASRSSSTSGVRRACRAATSSRCSIAKQAQYAADGLRHRRRPDRRSRRTRPPVRDRLRRHVAHGGGSRQGAQDRLPGRGPARRRTSSTATGSSAPSRSGRSARPISIGSTPRSPRDRGAGRAPGAPRSRSPGWSSGTATARRRGWRLPGRPSGRGRRAPGAERRRQDHDRRDHRGLSRRGRRHGPGAGRGPADRRAGPCGRASA